VAAPAGRPSGFICARPIEGVCRNHRRTRIEEVAARRLAAKFDGNVRLSRETGDLLLHADGVTHELTPEQAARLREDLASALTGTREFVYTSGERRADGRYIVARRGATSAGNRKVFDSFAALERLYESLPEAFTAEDLSRTGLTDSRRHIVLRHFVEHPDFACELTSRQPLTVRKL
jgi:hypothetical protein